MAEKKDKPVSLITPTGIATFSYVWEPHAFEEGGGKSYSLILVYSKKKVMKDKLWIALRSAVGKAAITKFGDKQAKALLSKGKLVLPWRDAEDYEKYGEPFVEGNIMLKASTNAKEGALPPGVVGPNAKRMMKQSDFYSGCLARMEVGTWAYDNSGNKGVKLFLNNVQKLEDGERLSGFRSDPEDVFDAVEGADDEDNSDIF